MVSARAVLQMVAATVAMLIACVTLSDGLFAQLPQISPGKSPRIRLAARANVQTAPSVPVAPDIWYVIEFERKQVGYEHLTTIVADGAGDHGILIRKRDTRLSLKRFGTDMSVSAFLETRETPDGMVQQWSLRRTGADSSLVERQGVWNPDEQAFDISERIQATRRTSRLSCSPQPRSPLISSWAPAMASLSARRFRSSVVFPETSAAADVDFETSGSQSLKLRSGKTIVVTRINFWPAADPALRTSLFVDSANVVVRTEQPMLGSLLSMEQADAATALGAASLESLDLDLSGIIAMTHPVTSPSKRAQTRLQITAGPAEQLTLPESTYQKVEQLSGNRIVVTLLRPPSASRQLYEETTRVTPPDRQYLASTRWATTDDPIVQRLTRSAVGGTTDPGESCRRMTQYLFTNMRRSAFSTQLLPANQSARENRGDCTEYAVLLAAMMRSARIPSRVVIGLVYSERASGFASHMWTEALINGEWMPFDAALSPTEFPAAYIRVADSSLSDDVTSGALLFLPLMNLIGRVKIELLPDNGVRTLP